MFTTRSSDHDDDTKTLSVQMSKLNIDAQEFVPAAAVFSPSDAGPSGLYYPAYFADGSPPCTGYVDEFGSTSQCVPRPGYENTTVPWSEESIPEAGPSFMITDNNVRGNEEYEQYTEYGYDLAQASTPVHVNSEVSWPQDPIPEPRTSIAKTTLKKRRKSDEKIETEQTKQKIIITKKKRLCKKKTKKDHVNLVLVGHVDAGKSTIGGQIMSLTGMVDKRTLEKYEREAREKSRESWYLSWALDINEEERDKGKTVEVGRAYFETEKKHFTILDAPGHKSFVPNMIGGAAQADLAVLVISARKGEFETGFERGGQTREHAMLVKTAGVKHLVVLITKMDDPTVNWEESRYNQCKDNILPFLKSLGFNSETDLSFLPVSGQTGQGLLEKVSEDVCPWYCGPSFITLLDELPSYNRNTDGPFTMPVIDKYKDMGTVLMGKVEAGVTYKGNTLILMPNKIQVTVDQLWSDDVEVMSVTCGEIVKIKLKGIEEEEVSIGFVLCDIAEPVSTGKVFDAQLVILQTKSIICAGYSAVMHVHCAAEEVTVKTLFCLVDKKTGEKSKTRPRFVKQGHVAIMRIECAGTICMEPYKKFGQLGRITLRDENKTIAIGKVLKVIS